MGQMKRAFPQHGGEKQIQGLFFSGQAKISKNNLQAVDSSSSGYIPFSKQVKSRADHNCGKVKFTCHSCRLKLISAPHKQPRKAEENTKTP
jgi:ferredoxin